MASEKVFEGVLLVVIIMLAVLLWGFSGMHDQSLVGPVSTPFAPYKGSQISRWTAEEAQVVCWVYDARSISCLPLESTALQREEAR